VGIGLGFPALVWYLVGLGHDPASWVPMYLNAFSFWFVIGAATLPTTIAAYSIVGEKVSKSLEPLLATPTTDSEILFGKGVAAFLPATGVILVGATIFMGLMNLATNARLGYYFFPNWNAATVIFLMVPLAAIMSVEWNVLVSSRVTDVRIAQQVGALMVIPLAGIYLAGEINLIPLGDTNNLLIIAGALALADVLLFYLARATFQREEILTRWK
jgi:ABC-type Na+ efflux pump permease subunit